MTDAQDAETSESKTVALIPVSWTGQVSRRVLRWGVLLTAFCLGLGWLLQAMLAEFGERLERRALLETTQAAAAVLNVNLVKQLTGAPADIDSPAFKELREELEDIRIAVPQARFAYLLGMKGDDVVFLADAEPTSSPDYSPPGQVYFEATEVLRGVLTSKVATTDGPVTDRWGVWVSALIPLIDQSTGKVVAILGVDVSGKNWVTTIAWFRWLGLAIAAVVAAIVLIAGLFILKQHRLALKLSLANRIVENSSTILYRIEGDALKMTFISGNIARLGYDPKQFLDDPHFYLEIVHPDDRAAAAASQARALTGLHTSDLLLGRIRARDGSYRWFENRLTFFRDASGRLLSVEGIMTDITERKLAQDKLAFANTLLSTELETSPDGILVVDDNRRIISFNRRFLELFNLPIELMHAGEDPPVLARALEAVKEPEKFLERVEYLYSHHHESARDEVETHDGRFLERQTSPLWTNGQYLGRVWFFRDITEAKNAERRIQSDLDRTQAQLRAMSQISQSPAILSGEVEILAREVTELAAHITGCERVNVWLFNEDESELRCIDSYEATPGSHSSGMILKESDFQHEIEIVRRLRYVNADDALTDPRTAGYVEPYIKPLGITSMLDAAIQASGQTFGLLCFEHVGHPHHWTPDEIAFACQLADKLGIALISRMRQKAEEKIRHSARHDGLTGLANREVFLETIERAMARSKRSKQAFAVLYLDLDHFKDVNDTLGHPVGDDLLRAVAERLRQSVRKSDLVARFGGDEFAVITESIRDPADAATLAGKLIDVLAKPFSIDGNEIHSGTSIGIAVCEPGDDDAETLLSRADIALYRAKSDKRGTYHFFTEELDAEVRTRVTLSGDLREAIASGQLFLQYQPQIDVESGRLVGLEALARWRHPVRGLLSPAAFIPVAEQSGLIGALDRWVLNEACRQGKAWIDAGVTAPTIAVNLSPLQFKMALELEHSVLAALADSGFPADKLELELTETALMGGTDEQQGVLMRLRRAGVRFAIDDFGTGYSSLDYLRRYPAKRLKIAQSFVARMGTDAGSASIVRAIVALAQELGMVAIAEGVETQEQVRMLKAYGCKEVQGYYYSKPLDAGDVLPLLRQKKIGPAEQDRTAA